MSGETDFATFVSGTTHLNGISLGMSRPFAAGRTITFDLGVARFIDGIGLWGLREVANALTDFSLFADDDDNFGNGAELLGTFNGALSVRGRAFTFDESGARFVHMLLLANGGGSQIRMGEVAFRTSRPTVELVAAPTVATSRVDFDDLPVGDTSIAAINAAGRSGSLGLSNMFASSPSGSPTSVYDRNQSFGRGLALEIGNQFEVIDDAGAAPFRIMSTLFLRFEQPIRQFGFRIGRTSGPMTLSFFEGGTRTGRLTVPGFRPFSDLVFVDYTSPFGSEGFDFMQIERNSPGGWVLTELEVSVGFDSLGEGCDGSGGELTLTPQTVPVQGSSYELQLSNAASSAQPGRAVMLLDLARLPAGGVDLDVIGAPGCLLRIAGFASIPFSTSNGTGDFGFAVPNNAGLVGTDLLTQAVDIDPAANALGVTTSNLIGFEIR